MSRYQIGTIIKPVRMKDEKCMVDTKRGIVYCIPLLQRYYEVPPDDLDFEDWDGDFGESLPSDKCSVQLITGVDLRVLRSVDDSPDSE